MLERHITVTILQRSTILLTAVYDFVTIYPRLLYAGW